MAPEYMQLQTGILIAITLAAAAWPQDAGRGARGGRGGPPPERPVAEEYLLLGNSTRGAGEPMVAVDPTDPRHIIAVAMGNLQILPGYKAPVTAGMTDKYHEVGNSTITWLGVTHDGGVTWKVGELPIISGKLTRCPDSFAGVTKTGIFLAGCEPRESAGEFFGMSGVVSSNDHGEAWSKLAPIVSSYQNPPFAAGLKPRIGGNSPWDRPFLYFDDQTGAVYSSSSGGETNVDTGAPERFRTQSYLTVSHTNGLSFGTVYATDSIDWPQQGRASVAAGHGALAEIYVASKVPASENATCPCQVFGISRDEGKTFQRHVMKNIALPPAGAGRGGGGPGGGPGIGSVISDPTTEGRYSVMKMVGAPSPHYEVSTSNDSGNTWSDFVKVPASPDAASITKPWIAYSRDGVIGLMWRAVYIDRTYDIWATISRDGGKSFSLALRISHAKSPGADYYRNGGNFGDDIQDLAMDKDNMHLVWGDNRAGFLGVWYGRVALSSFRMQ
jgi:hypothetical protein